MREKRFKGDLIEQAKITSGKRVLDVGCATGTLAIVIKRIHPDAEVVGIDADSNILGIARDKAAKADINVTLDQGMADQLPYANSSFDRVLSSLFLHIFQTKTSDARSGTFSAFYVWVGVSTWLISAHAYVLFPLGSPTHGPKRGGCRERAGSVAGYVV